MAGATARKCRPFFVSFAILAIVGRASAHKNYTFALIPKNTESEFFEMSHLGCEHQASKMENVTCLYIGPAALDLTGELQAQYIDDLIDEGAVDGMAISAMDAEAVQRPIARAVNAGIAVITFDSDAPGSERAAYVGTDNEKFGERLASVLDQVNPMGGTYAVVTSNSPNLNHRTESFRTSMAKLEGKRWTEFDGGDETIYYTGNNTETLREMAELAERYPYPQLGAIVPMQAAPMMAPRWKNFVDANRNMSFVSADMRDRQLRLLQRDYCEGLVGQHPFNMGEMSISTLFDLIHNDAAVPDQIFGTALVEVIRVPLDLPPLEVDMHYIDKLRYVGYALFGVVAALAIGLSLWTVVHRNDRVIRASQPPFLLLICLGALILASTMIPLGIDDQYHTQEGASIACMSVFWLLSIGFTLVFSALFAKTWRVNRIFHHPNKFKRVKVTPKDVMLPLVGLLVANVVVLTCWELIAPLEFVRVAHPGTDPWNRIISTYGVCREPTDRRGGVWVFLMLLAIINFGALLLANFQAYQARDIRTEYSESKYIGIVMLGILQLSLIGIPVLVLVQDNPRASYMLLTLIIVAACMGVLLLIYLPKIVANQRWQRKKAEKEWDKAARTAGRTTQTAGDANDEGQGLKVGLTREEELNREEGASSRLASVTASAGLRVVRMVKDSLLQVTMQDSQLEDTVPAGPPNRSTIDSVLQETAQTEPPTGSTSGDDESGLRGDKSKEKGS